MSLLIRLTLAGFFIGLLLLASWTLPAFPPAFGEWLTLWMSRIIGLDHWFPVRLTINLLLVILGVNVGVYAWKFAVWFKAFLLGDQKV